MADGSFVVLGDYSVQGLRPEGWARAVHRAAEIWGADRVIAENNQGGDMVDSVLRFAGVGLPVKMAPAVLGKSARAEPIAVLFERGEAKLAGAFPELEDELAGLTASGGYGGRGALSDRADACVWAMSELQGGVVQGPPRIRAL
jgi:phage terminase large subunit-like protein